ncbi:MAG TPA: hypothetical protein VM493_13050 [Vicinamibacterales bacterium]|nr:hypothetical protein [Vicinamibacterales bacterium]
MQTLFNGLVGLRNLIVVVTRAFSGRPAQHVPPLIVRAGKRDCAARADTTAKEKEDPPLNSFGRPTWITMILGSDPALLGTRQSENRLPDAPGLAIAAIRGRSSG